VKNHGGAQEALWQAGRGMRQLSGSFLTKKEELSFGEADSQRRNPLGLSIKKYEYLWNSLYVKKYEYLWNRVVLLCMDLSQLISNMPE
jgi:hypothetical protein